QAGDRRLPGATRPGLCAGRVTARGAGCARRVRRRHPSLPRAPARPVVLQPAVHPGPHRGRDGVRCHRERRQHRPRDGRCRSLMAPENSALDEATREQARALMARYPKPRSALLPMLHLVQSVDGYVTPQGIGMCAELLGLTKAEVGAVATFYTMYKRRPVGDYHVGVCTNTLCAVMGGDFIYEELKKHLGIDTQNGVTD